MNSEIRPTRIAGWLALIVGAAYVAFTLFVMAPQRILGQWTAHTSIFGDVLSLLLAAILISAGWHELSLASKVRPQVVPLRQYVLRVGAKLSQAGTKLSQLGATRPRFAGAVLFLIFGYAGAQFAHYLFELVVPTSGFAWLVWALEFPAYMFVTVVIATRSGLLPQQSRGNVLRATATLLVANFVATVFFFTFVLVIWILAFIPAVIACAFFVAMSRGILAEGALRHGGSSRETTSVMRFWGRLVLIGMPLGIAIGFLPFFRADNSTLFMPQIQMVWGTMIGLSLVESKAKPVS